MLLWGENGLAAYSLFRFFFQIQVILDREQEIARQQLAAGHKDRALVALRRRKYQGGLLVKTDGQLENLEQLVRVPIVNFWIPLPPRLRTLLTHGCEGLDDRVLSHRSLRATWPQTGQRGSQGDTQGVELRERGEVAGGNRRSKGIPNGAFLPVASCVVTISETCYSRKSTTC